MYNYVSVEENICCGWSLIWSG